MSSGCLISVETLAGLLDNDQVRILDCRFSLADKQAGQQKYVQGHIPGALYADLEQDMSAAITVNSGRHPLPDPVLLAKKIGQWGIDNSTQVVVYDDIQGAMAARMWWLLRWLGHHNVAVLDGGLSKWLAEGRALSTLIPSYAVKQYNSRVNQSAWLSTQMVVDEMEKKNIALLDARTAERFAGKEEPIDPVTGHVPGAINRPFQWNLNADGTFQAAEKLKQSFQNMLQTWQPGQVVHMCGSGVTACHNLLAMEIAGLSGSKLYVGSWSEWIRDRARPVACE